MPAVDAEPVMDGDASFAPPASPSQRRPGDRAVTVLWSFGKCLGALLPVYLAGYYGFSISVVLFGLVIFMGWKHSRLDKVMRLKSAMYLLENERTFTTESVFRAKRDLPPWRDHMVIWHHHVSSRVTLCALQVNFPDVEKVEWVNKIIQQAWPFIGQYLEKLLVETIAPAIRASSIHLQTLSFTKVDIGEKVNILLQNPSKRATPAVKVVGVKAHTEQDRRQVILDLYLSYAGDVEINVEIKKYFCKAGVKGVQLHGKLRVILEPLIGNIPLVGAVTMFFIRRPKLDINWTGLTNLLDIPGLSAMSDTMIMDAIASQLVLPNRLTVPLVADLHVAQLRSPLPRGVVRIHLLEAEDLTAKDTVIKGLIDGKSDPYAVLRVGTQIFTSHHIDSNLNPQWREMYEVIVHEVPGQELEVEVFDKDPDQDDFLGRSGQFSSLMHTFFCRQWFNLKDVPSGSVHLRLEWLSLLSSAERLSEVIQKNQNLTSKTEDPPSAAILAIYLDQAQDLPLASVWPSCLQTCYGTNSPIWSDAFTFFIQDPSKQDIDIQVKDDDRALSLGTLTIPLMRLLGSPELTMDQWFQLENSGSASRIYVKIVLRNTMGSSGLGKPLLTRPQHTSPDPEFATEGVLRIHLMEAQNLIAKDNFMGGMVKGKSDPYVKIRVAGITYRSHTIKENLNPTWNELYEVILTQLPGQEIQFELFDKDIDQDDFLGRCNTSLTDKFFSLFLSLISAIILLTLLMPPFPHRFKLNLRDIISAQFIDTILQYQAQQSYQNKVVPSSAMLFVYVERAHGLPVCERSTSPRWDEGFHFLVRDPKEETLTVKVISSIYVLLEPGMVLDRWINLDGALPESQILLRVMLKVSVLIDLLPVGKAALAACSKDGADPYVSFILLPDKKATTKRRTATKKRDLNPEFNERFDFDFSLEESYQRRLDLSVKNSVSFMSRERELIGKLQLDLEEIDLKACVTQW
uniref:Extended synaptotagmin-like protein 1a n=1 Tax=Takifugu rubripes TaxID=31033 RepID=O73807_TAKRU|nr:unknown [Takifugu rubripes]